jgi:hypothetical protein
MIKDILKIWIIVLIGFAIGLCEYQIYGKIEEYTKVYSGTVLHSFASSGRSSTCFATISFDNGDIQEVNTGHYLYSKGDSFRGRLEWNPIFGVMGYAYSWNPGSRVMIMSCIAGVFNFCVIAFVIFKILIFVFKDIWEKI